MRGQLTIERSRSLTERDLAIVEWIGRVGAVTIEQTAQQFELGKSVAYERIAVCVEKRLIARTQVLHGSPTILTATRRGLAATGLALRVVRVSPALARHHLTCGWVALWLGRHFRDHRVLSDRELRFEEGVAGRPIASAELGELADGSPQLHRPDFAAVGSSVEAFEVELTAKAPRRLEALVQAWRSAAHVSGVTYLCGPGQVRGAVERAIERTYSEQRVRVVPIEEVVG